MRAAEIRSKSTWAVTTASIVVITALLWAFFPQNPQDARVSAPLPVRNLALGLAVGLAVLSSVIRSLLLSRRRLERLLERETMLERLQEFGERERKLLALPACLYPAFVVGWSFNEAIFLLGAGLVLVSGNFADVIPFAFAAIALNAVSFPRLEPHIRRLEILART